MEQPASPKRRRALLAIDSVIPTILDDRHAWAVIQTEDDTRRGDRPNIASQLAMTADGGVNWKDVTVPVPD